MWRFLLVLWLFPLSGCFTGNSNSGPIPRDFCGTEKSDALEMEVPRIFTSRCATCHSFHKDLIGPKMKGILDRVPSEEWLRSFITNQDSLIAVGDSVTLKIIQWSPVKWSHHLSNVEPRDFDTLISYITQ